MVKLLRNECLNLQYYLTLSWWRPLSYRKRSIDLLGKSMDWFLYDNGLRHERVNIRNSKPFPQIVKLQAVYIHIIQVAKYTLNSHI